MGLLSVTAQPWGSVYLDGQKIALETPMVKYKVASGSHRVRVCFTDKRSECSAERRIDIVNGLVKVVRFRR